MKKLICNRAFVRLLWHNCFVFSSFFMHFYRSNPHKCTEQKRMVFRCNGAPKEAIRTSARNRSCRAVMWGLLKRRSNPHKCTEQKLISNE